MNKIQTTLQDFYYDSLRPTKLFQDMGACIENSPWHREANTLTHTDMAVDHFVKLIPSWESTKEIYRYFPGLLATALHDVGKPACKVRKFKEERGEYFSFAGHELMSARLAEDFLMSRYSDSLTPREQEAAGSFREFLAEEGEGMSTLIPSVAWMIENHLVYQIGKARADDVARTARKHGQLGFCNMVMSDVSGRIEDNPEEGRIQASKILEGLTGIGDGFGTKDDYPVGNTAYFPIAASGTGKSTWARNTGTNVIFSMDELRLQLYGEDYSQAFKASCEDPGFSSNVNKEFLRKLEHAKSQNLDIVIDNCNLTRKSRRQFIDFARSRGFVAFGLTFPISLETLESRQANREDKQIDFEVSRSQYFRIQQPSLGEFDYVA